jgi:SAM-dependent methyltransferase
MSAEFPSAWAQTCPRSVRLAPGGLLVPAATLRVLLRNGRRQELLVGGYAMEPALRDGDLVAVRGGVAPGRGDLVLCDLAGWGDFVRLLRRERDGAWRVALDAFPLRPTRVAGEQILGVVEAPGAPGRVMAGPAMGGPASAARRAGGWATCCIVRSGASALRAPVAGWRLFWRRIDQAPRFGDQAEASVQEKYRQQVGAYAAQHDGNLPGDEPRGSNLDPDLIAILGERVPRGGSILVAGCGTGSEAVHLAGLGYQVTAFDILPQMIDVARAAAAGAGVSLELLTADLCRLDLQERRFDAAYLTPLLYSFVAGRELRIAVLKNLARHLRDGGPILLSAQPYRGPTERLQTLLAFARRRMKGWREVEPGDWYTWFLTPKGEIGYSYLHRFSAAAIRGEIREAGLTELVTHGAHRLVGGAACGDQGKASIAGQKSASFRK